MINHTMEKEIPVVTKEIYRRMKEKGFNPRSLSEKAGLGETYVRDLKKNKSEPRHSKLSALAKALDCQTKDLQFPNSLEKESSLDSNYASLPLPEMRISIPEIKIGSGIASFIDLSDISKTWEVPDVVLKNSQIKKYDNLGIFCIQGTSMRPEFHPGERVLVDLSETEITHDGTYVFWNDNILDLKHMQRLQIDNKHVVRIIPANPIYSHYDLSPSDLKIAGRVAGKWDWL